MFVPPDVLPVALELAPPSFLMIGGPRLTSCEVDDSAVALGKASASIVNDSNRPHHQVG